MKRKVTLFFTLLIVFALVLAFLSYSQTGKISNISGYSVAVENEKDNSGVIGIILSGVVMGILFSYIVKFIFESYERKSKPTEFKRHINLDLL